jgi:hypothetical protein
MFFLPTSPKEAKAQLADWSAHVLKGKRDQPKVMYHGTNTKFFQFDKERISGMSANEFGSRSECARGTSCGERAIRRAPRRDAGRASAGLINHPFCNTTYRERHDLSELIGQ